MTVRLLRDYENKNSHLTKPVVEAKKNPSKDVHRMSGMFFQIGLGMSIALAITAFEWRTEVKQVSVRLKDEPPNDWLLVVPPTDNQDPLPPSPIKMELKPMAPIISTTPIVLSNTPNEAQHPDPIVEPALGSFTPTAIVADDPEPCDECIEGIPRKTSRTSWRIRIIL